MQPPNPLKDFEVVEELRQAPWSGGLVLRTSSPRKGREIGEVRSFDSAVVLISPAG